MDEINHVLRSMPRRFLDAFADPIRRRHVVGQSTLCYLSALPFTGNPGELKAHAMAGGVAFLNFALYEFVLEPLAKRVMVKRQEMVEKYNFVPSGYTKLRRPLRSLLEWVGRHSWFGPYWERGPRDGEKFERE